IAFKPNTDDIRDSVSITLIKELLKNNAKVVAHDPMALENAKKIFKKKIQYTSSIKDALKNSDCGVVITDWKDYEKISKKDVANMKNKIIIDSRRMLKRIKSEVDYFAFGIGN
ncbi:UDP-glucose 6-dehydrogenase protein, partial [Marine Group I thaumarchaeote SCGC AAA799-E16]